MPSPPSAFVLASRSPRRVAYLREAGYVFEALPADVPEVPLADEAPGDYALRVARAKVAAVLAVRPGALVRGADTDVVVDGRILGQPADAREAGHMLASLSGRTHEVLSAVVFSDGIRSESLLTRTEIDFVTLGEADLAAYLASGEWQGKAGAYGIQGAAARFVRALRGSYTGVVGLPMAETAELLTRFSIAPSRIGA